MTDTRNDDSGLVQRLRMKAGAIEMGDRIAWGSDSSIMRKAATRLEAQEAEIARLRNHARRMSEALTLVRPLGGSELFVKVGDEFYADPKYCGDAISKLKDDLHNAKVKAVAEGRELSTLNQEVEKLREALTKARDALRPFYCAVFNDNGDITVTGNYNYDEAISGYFAYKKADAALSNQSTASLKVEGAWTRNDLADGLAMLDGITLHRVDSTIGDPQDTNNWREYLGRADDLMAYLSARLPQPAEGQGERGEALHLTEYEIQVLLGCSINGCNMSPDRVFSLPMAWHRLHAVGLIDRTDGLAIVTEKGQEAIQRILSADATPPAPQPLEGAVKVSDIIHQIALWADDEGLELSKGQGEDLARRIRSALVDYPRDTKPVAFHETPNVRDNALSAPAGDGWRLVPVEPTEVMLEDGVLAYNLTGIAGGIINTAEDHVAFIWQAMLPASPYQGDGR